LQGEEYSMKGYLTPFTCKFHSLQIPILASSVPYSFHFPPNSILCNFLSLQIQVYLSLHFPFLANSALRQNRPLSFHLPFLANAFPCKVRRPDSSMARYGEATARPQKPKHSLQCFPEILAIKVESCQISRRILICPPKF